MRRYKIDYEKMYEEYLTQHKKTTAYAIKRGGSIRDIKPSSYKDFKTDFNTALIENPKKSPKALAREMAKDELFETSSKQARKLAEVHEQVFGEKVSIGTISKYRLGIDTGLWDVIKEQRKLEKELRPEASTYVINKIIAEQFFGS